MMREIRISDRLHTIAAMIPVGSRVADIGTDHARLPVWLVQQGISPSVIASDVLPMPLQRARETLEYWGLLQDPRLTLRLGDGLSGIGGEEVDSVVIAGMGGSTIAGILESCPWVPGCRHQFLLQPMSSADDLRTALHRLGFSVLQERLVRDNGTLYTVLEAKQGDSPGSWESWMSYVSPALLWGNDPLREEYIDHLLRRLERALEGARRSGKSHDGPRAALFEEILIGLKRAAGREHNANRS